MSKVYFSKVYFSEDRQSCAWRNEDGWRIQTKNREIAKELRGLKSARLTLWGLNIFVNIIRVSDAESLGALLVAGIRRGCKKADFSV